MEIKKIGTIDSTAITRSLRVFCSLFALLYSVGCSRERWIHVSPGDSGFAVSMPETPTRRQQALDFAFGKLMRVNYTATKSNTVFMVTFIDYPKIIMNEVSTERILSMGVQQIITRDKSVKILENSSGRFQGFPSKDFVLDHSSLDDITIGKLVLVSNRMYFIQVETTKKQATDHDVRRFMNSFKLTQAAHASQKT